MRKTIEQQARSASGRERYCSKCKFRTPNKICSYIYGNPVILNEYGDFGTEDKPWLSERTTVIIPIEYHLEDKE